MASLLEYDFNQNFNIESGIAMMLEMLLHIAISLRLSEY